MISEAEALCADFAGAKAALFFTCGSTQGIHTMLAEAVGMGGTLILDRGCHKSVYNAMALLDITPYYIYPDSLPNSPLSGAFTIGKIADALLLVLTQRLSFSPVLPIMVLSQT